MRRRRENQHIPLAYRAEKALKRAVAKALAEHKKNGIPIAVWRDGKVVRIPPDQIEVREPKAMYTTSRKRKTS